MKLFLISTIGLLLFVGVTRVEPMVSEYIQADSTLLVPLEKHRSEALVVASLLEQHHYRKTSLGDSLSTVIFDDYLESLDYNKAYFLKSDIDYFKKYRNRLDDDLKRGEVDVPFQIFRIYRERLYERVDKILASLHA